MKEKVPVSVVILTKNEESCIGECLESVVNWASEVIVVDDESTDKTLEIVRKYPVVVFQRKMDIEGKHRNWAYQQARNAWVLSLDADEQATPALGEEIACAIKSDEFIVYVIPLRNYIGDHWVRHGGWYPASKTRLFLKDRFKYEEVEVHPRAIYHGKCGHLKADIIHKGYPDIEHFLGSVNRQSTLEAVKWIKTNRKMTGWLAFRRAVSRFYGRYVNRAAFRDGIYGFVIAYFDSLYQVLSYVKYREMLKMKKGAAQ